MIVSSHTLRFTTRNITILNLLTWLVFLVNMEFTCFPNHKTVLFATVFFLQTVQTLQDGPLIHFILEFCTVSASLKNRYISNCGRFLKMSLRIKFSEIYVLLFKGSKISFTIILIRRMRTKVKNNYNVENSQLCRQYYF